MRSQKAIPVDPEHFGHQLKEARLRTGRSLDDVARRTKIPSTMLEKIEQGDAASMPADVFACGFLRAYAREVGVDGEESVMRFRRLMKAPSHATMSHEIDRAKAHEAKPDAAKASSALEKLEKLEKIEGEPRTLLGPVDELIGKLTARVPAIESALGRGPTFALVVLLVVLVATITLSLLLGGDPRPGRGLS